MMPGPILLEHLAAAVLVWGWAYVGGRPLAALLRPRLGFAAAAVLGMAYWSVALFAFPFDRGLDWAAGLAVLGNLAVGLPRPGRYRPRWADAILLVGLGSTTTLLFTNYVPPGMDASMHTTAARLIAVNGDLPRTYAPLAPDLKLPAVNLGLPALAARAVRSGVSPPAATLAAEHFTFAEYILAGYLFLRLWVPAAPAALLAVLSFWGSRGVQDVVGFGGFPTVAGVAVGLLAGRLLIDVARRPRLLAILPLGVTVGAIPLIHGVSAAGWVYVVAPIATVVGLTQSQRPKAAFGILAAAAGLAGLIAATYVVVGEVRMTPEAAAWTREWQGKNAPRGRVWELAYTVPGYVKSAGGNLAVWGGTLATAFLLIRRRYWSAAAMIAGGLILCVLVLNSRGWFLPLSALLYPERVCYYATPLAATAAALAWKAAPVRFRARTWVRLAILLAVVPVAGLRHYQIHQRQVFAPVIRAAEYEALAWAGAHLDLASARVQTRYNTAGSFLPAVAGLRATRWHVHHFTEETVRRANDQRPPTHRFEERAVDARTPDVGPVVFENAAVVIRRLEAAERSP